MTIILHFRITCAALVELQKQICALFPTLSPNRVFVPAGKDCNGIGRKARGFLLDHYKKIRVQLRAAGRIQQNTIDSDDEDESHHNQTQSFNLSYKRVKFFKKYRYQDQNKWINKTSKILIYSSFR